MPKTDAEAEDRFKKCPFYFNGWCEKFNGKCSDIKSCDFKVKAKKK